METYVSKLIDPNSKQQLEQYSKAMRLLDTASSESQKLMRAGRLLAEKLQEESKGKKQ